jgi:threonine/homoserine/homoserine lactone efflux protein
VAGLAIVAQAFSAVFVIVKCLGVAYLLFLARKMWLAPSDVGRDRLPERRQPWRMFAAGMAVTLGNPKIALFYLALVPTMIDLQHVGLVSWLQLVTTMAAVLIAVDLGWALVAVRARRLLTNRRAVQVANRSSAALMASAAVAIAVK